MRGCTIPLLCLVLASGCARSEPTSVGPDPAATTAPSASESAGGKARLGPPPEGLALEVALKGPRRVQAGSRIELRAELVNGSRDRAIPVVQGGDGSDFGWREPQLFYVVELDTGGHGRWTPAPSARPGRCGNYDEDWTDEVRTIAPGERLDLELGQGPEVFWDMHEGGRARVRLGYRYGGGGQRGLAQSPAPDVPAALAAVAPFELLSEPIELELAQDWTLELTVHGKLRANRAVSVADVFDVRLVSRGDVAIDVQAPGWLHGAPFYFEVREVRDRPEGSKLVWQDATMDPGLERPSAKLAPRETLRLIGDTERFGRYDGTWTWPTPGVIHVRAAFLGVRGMDLRSSWMAVTVE